MSAAKLISFKKTSTSPPQFLHDESVSTSHLVTAMTFNIGDADIRADSESDLIHKYNDNIFIKILQRCFDTSNPLPDILIFGLQEVPDKRLQKIQPEFSAELEKLQHQKDEKSVKILAKKYKFITIHEDKPYINLCNFNYKIVTIILVSDRIHEPKIDKDNIIMYCPGLEKGKPGTKGFTLIKLNYSYYNEPQPSLHIVNLHAPFKTADKTTKFFNKLFANFTGMDTNTNNIIIMGDYNSRSLITKNKKYIKDVDPSICSSLENDKYDEIYCQRKSELESMPAANNRLFGVVPDSMNPEYEASNSFKSLRDELKLKEYKLQFLPSYKRQTQKQYAKNTKSKKTLFSMSSNKSSNTLKKVKAPGQFSLEKGSGREKKYRLPGYADRITVLGKKINLLPENMYTSIPVIGNDHIPVVATFAIQYAPPSSTMS